MIDNRKFYAASLSVFERRGEKPVVNTERAHCDSNRFAKMVANCLNLYHRNSRFAAQVDAAEKGEQHNGNCNDGATTDKGSQHDRAD